MLQNNLSDVQNKILAACERSNRNSKEVTLIAVSKTKPVSMLQEVYNCDHKVFGENKVQELCDKIETMPADIKWHMIGHLQSNKVKYIVGKVDLIHSVESLSLAKEIQRISQKHNVITPILIEVNIAKEDSKFGLFPDDVLGFIKEISVLPNIQIQGLMTVAPFVSDPEENRHYFKQMKDLSVDIDNQNIDNVHMNILSMGMTGDYEVAIEEGATMVRVGTGIFGERKYTI